MKKILIFILFLFFINKINANAVQEINIVCKDNEICLNESKKPIFNEENIYPGFSINKRVKISNKTENVCDLNLKLSKENKNDKLAEKILFGIDKKNYFLNKIFNKKIFFGKIKPNSLKVINFSYIFDKDTGNEFKNQKIDFDINFNFFCENIQEKILGIKTETKKPDLFKNPVFYLFLVLFSITNFFILSFRHLHQKTNLLQKRNVKDH